MDKPKVVVTDYPEANLDWEAEQLAQRGVEFTAYQLRHAPQSQLIAAIADAHIIVTAHADLNGEVIAALRRCQLIIRHGVGYDDVDIAAATDRGIRVAYYPDYCTQEVAEHAVTLLLACARQLPRARQIVHQSSQQGQWDYSRFAPIYRIQGQTLGIIGCGRIGSRVYQLTASLGLRRIICDPYLPEERLGELGIESRFSLEELLSQSDFVTIHTPLNDETKHMIGAHQFQMMKPTAYLINTARGAIVDTCALINVLRAGGIAGAGIDVYETEPPPPDSELLGLDNVVLSPHAAWCSEQSADNIRKRILQDIYRCLDEQRPELTVNEEVDRVLNGRAYRQVE